MSLLTVKARQCIMPEHLISVGLTPKEDSDDFAWLDTCIRSEDIMLFYKRSDAKVVISFYEDRPSMVIKESFDNFVKAVSLADYNVSSYEEQD